MEEKKLFVTWLCELWETDPVELAMREDNPIYDLWLYLDEETPGILRQKAELDKHVEEWSICTLWFALKIKAAKRRPPIMPTERHHWRLKPFSECDEELDPWKYRETLHRVCTEARRWCDYREFAIRVRCLEQATPEELMEDEDVADKFYALEQELWTIRDSRRDFVAQPIAIPEEFPKWLETMANLRKESLIESKTSREFKLYLLRPGDRETQMRGDLGTEVKNVTEILKATRSTRSRFYLTKNPLDDPQSKGMALIYLFDLHCKAKGYTSYDGRGKFLAEDVLFADSYFERRKTCDRTRPYIVKALGRFDVLCGDDLYLSETADCAIWMWIYLSREKFVERIIDEIGEHQ